VGAAAATVLGTKPTAAGIPHGGKVYPGAKHAFFNGQWRAYHLAAAVGTPSSRVDGLSRGCRLAW
jgi:hypothetical protein